MILLIRSIELHPVQDKEQAENTPEMLTLSVSGWLFLRFSFEIVLVLEKNYKNNGVFFTLDSASTHVNINHNQAQWWQLRS